MNEKQKPARKLTAAEQRRLEAFEALSERMTGQGYRRNDLTINISRANVFAVLLLIPLAIIGVGLYLLVHQWSIDFGRPGVWILLLAVFVALIVLHELIHGLTWSLFTPNRFKDIEFGVMMDSLTPYCTCKVPLTKAQYITGALMPLILLGILPMVAGIVFGSLRVLLLGIFMADAAAGDILIVWKLLKYRTDAAETVYIDHPTQAGGVIFER